MKYFARCNPSYLNDTPQEGHKRLFWKVFRFKTERRPLFEIPPTYGGDPQNPIFAFPHKWRVGLRAFFAWTSSIAFGDVTDSLEAETVSKVADIYVQLETRSH